MMLGLFWMAVANAAILLGSHELLRRVRTGIASADVTIFILIRLTLVSLVVLASLCVGGFNTTALGIAGAAALALLLAAGAHRRLPSFQRIDLGRPGAFLAAALILRLAAQVWFFAPSIGDVTSYHLPKIGEWITHGTLTLELGEDFRSSFPAGFELVEAWWTVFLHHDVLIEAAGIEFLALAFAAALSLGRWIGLSERGSALAAFLYVLVPGLHLQATACLNDAPVASIVVAIAALIAARAPVSVALMAAGLAIGIKPTFGYALPGLAVFFWLARKDPQVATAPRWTPVLAVAGLLLGGFWYGRNTVIHGNPVHPMGKVGIVGADGKPLIPSHPSLSNLKDTSVAAVERRLHDRSSPYTAMSDRTAGWGVGIIALGLPALIPAIRDNRRLRRLAVAFFLSVAGVFISVLPDIWFMRFILFFPLLPCLAAAWLAQRLPPVRILAGAALALQFLATFVPNELPNEGLSRLASLPWRERIGTTFPGGYTLPEGPVGCFQIGPAYPLYGPDFRRRVIYFREQTGEELLRALKRESVATVYANAGLHPIQELVASGALERQVGSYFQVRGVK